MSNSLKSPKTSKSAAVKKPRKPASPSMTLDGIDDTATALAAGRGEAPPAAKTGGTTGAATTGAVANAGPAVMSPTELAQLGGGIIAYIKVLSNDEARRMFPAVEGLPHGVNLYALHAADGTPLALTDSMSAAISHAMGDELAIATVH